MRHIASLLATLAALGAGQATAAADTDWARVDQTLGRKGATSTADIHRYGFPRSDLNVSVDGVTINPSFALGGWVAFEAMPSGDTMMMGDLVLLDSELEPVMNKILDEGLEVSAIHNHLLRTSV